MVFRRPAGARRRRARPTPGDRSAARTQEPGDRQGGPDGPDGPAAEVPAPADGAAAAPPGAPAEDGPSPPVGDGDGDGDGAGRWFAGTGAATPGAMVLADVDRSLVQVFALVGEGIAGATDALLACDRGAAKDLVARDDLVDHRIAEIGALAHRQLVTGDTTEAERAELVAVLRMLPDLDRNGDLAAHVARRAARGLGSEMSARSRGLVERMGEVAATIWSSTADAFAERSATAAGLVDALDDEMDDLHVTLTAELVAGTMPLPVAIELAMVARFYERFGDHAVLLARRIAALVGGTEPPGAEPPGAV